MVSLVTGATGFIGGRLIRLLERQGKRARALLRQTSDAQVLNDCQVDIVRGDLMDPKTLTLALDGVDTIYHVASPGLADMVREQLSPDEMISPLIHAAQQAGLPRLIYLSTIKARLSPMSLKNGLQSLDIYGLRKQNDELRLMREPDLPWVIVRASAVYGPGDRKSLPIFRLASGSIVPMIKQSRLGRFSMVHVDELVDALTCIGTKTAESRCLYEIGDPVGHDWNDLMMLLAAPSAKKIYIQPFLLHGVGRFLSTFSNVSRGGGLLVRERVLDILKNDWLVDENLRFTGGHMQEPSQNVVVGLKATLSWYRENGWLK